MTVGRGPAARMVADLAQLASTDTVVDIGCGPGTAVRVAARRSAAATGVDPSPASLRLARWITARHGIRNATFLPGTAERLPVGDASATVIWALSSFHHWDDPPTALVEIRRVLRSGGRLLIAERRADPGARGHARHGIDQEAANQLVEALREAGFDGTRGEVHGSGRTTRRVVRASAPHDGRTPGN